MFTLFRGVTSIDPLEPDAPSAGEGAVSLARALARRKGDQAVEKLEKPSECGGGKHFLRGITVAMGLRSDFFCER